MRNIILVLFLYSVHSFGQNRELEINVDTININIKGEITSAIKVSDKYYCFFETSNLQYSTLSTKHFYILSLNGTIEHTIDVPKDINDESNFYFHVRNDSIIVKTDIDHHAYYLDTSNFKWEKIKVIDDLVFQDEMFYVTYLDFGEWGGTIWFKDKNTNIEYEASSSFPVINKFNGKYVITCNHRIFEIGNPLKMKICKKENRYSKVNNSVKFHEGSNSTLGTKTLFRDTTDIFISKFRISTSFIFDNRLINLYVDKKTAYLATLENGTLISEKTIGNIIPLDGVTVLKDNSQSLKFNTDDEHLFGFIDIKENKIFVHYLKNIYPPRIKYLGTNYADSAFASLFNTFNSENGDLSINKVDSIEQRMGSEDITPPHYIELGTDYYPNSKHFKLETPRAYLRVEDSIFSNQIEYYYTNNNGSIKAILFEWNRTRNNSGNNPICDINVNDTAEKFQQKFDKLEHLITGQIGQPTKINIESVKHKATFSDEIMWKLENGLVADMFMSGDEDQQYRQIRLVIHKQ